MIRYKVISEWLIRRRIFTLRDGKEVPKIRNSWQFSKTFENYLFFSLRGGNPHGHLSACSSNGGNPASTAAAAAEMVRKPLTTLMVTVLCNLLTFRRLRRLAIRSSAQIGAPYSRRTPTPGPPSRGSKRPNAFAGASTDGARRSKWAWKVQWLSRVRPRYFMLVPTPISAPSNLRR